MNLNPNIGNNQNYIVFKQPRLLRINQPPDTSSYNQSKYDFEQKNHELRKRIHDLNKLHRQNKEEQDNYELNRMLTCFYKNPFNYMEFLAKRYFVEKANTLENLKIKEEMTNNFKKLFNQIEDQIRNYTSNEQMKLKELERIVETKLKGESLPFNQDIFSTNNNENENNKFPNYNNKKENQRNKNTNNINMNSENMSEEEKNEFVKRILGNFGSYGPMSMEGVTTNGNAANYVINNKISDLNEENIYKDALSCLKEDKIVVPKNNFIAVKELTLKDINQNKIQDAQNIYDLKEKMKIEEYNNQIMGKNKDKNGQKIKNTIELLKKNEKKDLDDLISYSNNHIKNMKQYQQEKEKLINYVKKKLNKEFEENAVKLAMNKLSVCEQNLNQIQNEINNKNTPENPLINWDERKELMEKDYRDTQTIVNNFLNGRGASLSKPVKKVNKNKSKSKKKRNFSANPYNKKYNYRPKKY